MAKTLVICALAVLVPLTNLRMICVDHAGPARASATVTANGACDEMCPRTPPAPTSAKTGCVLVAGGCSVVTAFVVALPAPSSAPLASPQATIVSFVSVPDLYHPPVRAPFSPPPEV